VEHDPIEILTNSKEVFKKAVSKIDLEISKIKALGILCHNWKEDHRWLSKMSVSERESKYFNWKRAVERSFDWNQGK